MTNAQRKEQVSATQAAVDEAQQFIHDVLSKVINPSDVVIVYREPGGGFGVYTPANADPVTTCGLLTVARAALVEAVDQAKD